MEENPVVKRIIVFLLAFIFIIGVSFRIYWTRGGPSLAYFYGDLLILFSYIITGLLVTVRAVIILIKVKKQYSSRKDEATTKIIKKQVVLAIIGSLVVLLGALVSILRFRQ
jgi:hypothetical protein